MKQRRFLNRKVFSVLTGVTGILTVAGYVGSYVCQDKYSAALNMAFGTSDYIKVDDPNAEKKTFFESDYGDVDGDLLFSEDTDIIREVEKEGATLLWNKEKTLPLASESKVSCFSHSSVDLVETGSGSGYVTSVSQANPNKSQSVDLKTALEEDGGFIVNPTLWNFYKTGAGAKYTRTNPKASCTEGQKWKVNEVPQSAYTSQVKSSYSEYGDCAFVVISRSGGEYSDLHYSNTEESETKGNYLALTDEEKALLHNIKSLKEDGTFKKTVLLLNTANPIMLDEFRRGFFSSIDACLWIGQVGTSGIRGVADILSGKANPSGRITDTYAYNLEAFPSTVNDGSYQYGGDCSGLNEQGNGIYRQRMYLAYQEDIYIGYRYMETRYEDFVLGENHADSTSGAKESSGGWDYGEEVAFPFGYGLSYTDFSYSGYEVKESKDGYDVSVVVRNDGEVEGKDVVQIYLQKPYTQFDRENGIEKASVELVGYRKTSLLKPGAEEKITVQVPKEQFKTYDDEINKTYILEAGKYYLTAADNSHTAINNILKKKGKSVKGLKTMAGETEDRMGEKFVYEIDVGKTDTTTYSHSASTGELITNQLESGDMNKYEYRGDNEITYLSRNDWEGTYPTTPQLVMNEEMKNDLRYDIDPEEDETDIMPLYNQSNGRSIIEFMDAPFNKYSKNWDQTFLENGKVMTWEKMWDELLDQMSFEEQAKMCANAYHQINGAASISMDTSKQENGPVGITKRTEAIFAIPNQDTVSDWTWVAYNCAPVCASTFNNDLIQNLGKHMSEDMLYLGYNGIYGPGVNLHRSPFGGRNFEYPSEDPYLAGTIEYYKSKGIENKGCIAYAKHYALNDMETNRRHVGIWSREQASREIYLKAFEIVFSEGGASGTMNSFTRIGTRWCGASKALMTTILRDEWGYDGIVISDWDSGGSMSKIDGILAGTNSFDGNGNEHSFDKWKGSKKLARALRESSKTIIYNVVRTNAMNGYSLTTKTIKVVPSWVYLFYGISSGFAFLFVLSLFFLVLSILSKKKQA